MRRAALVLATTATLAALPATTASADTRPLPEIQHCDPAACPNPLEGVQECVRNGLNALVQTLNGTPWMATCDPFGR